MTYVTQLARLELIFQALERNSPEIDLRSREELMAFFRIFGDAAEREASLEEPGEAEALAATCLARFQTAFRADETIH